MKTRLLLIALLASFGAFGQGESYCGQGTIWNSELQKCVIENIHDSNYDGCIDISDLLDFLVVYGGCQNEELDFGCTIDYACNYNPNALTDDGSCLFGGSNESSCDDGDPYTFNDTYQEDGCTCIGIQSVNPNGTGPCEGNNTIFFEGYDYRLVEINDQCWYQENIRYLPNVSPTNQYSYDEPKHYVYGYNGDNVTEAQYSEYYNLYGGLYNYPAIINSNLCPSGWHVSTGDDWIELAENYGGITGGLTGTYLKSNYGWDGSPGNGNNESGFEGLPGGRVFGNQSQSQISTLEGLYGIWWTTPPPVNNGVNPMYITLSHNGNSLGDGFENDHLVGYSARCIKD